MPTRVRDSLSSSYSSASASSPTSDSPSSHPTLIIVDGFSPYHSGYFRSLCQDRDVNVVDLYSDYVAAILLQAATKAEEAAEVEASRIPNPSDVEAFVNGLPSEPTALYCESDAGLRQAEELASNLNLDGERHNDVGDCR